MDEERKARAVGFNHVALEVGDIEEALAFYRRLFDFELRGKSATSAFIDLGDQFLALQKGRTQPADEGRHFGLVVLPFPMNADLTMPAVELHGALSHDRDCKTTVRGQEMAWDAGHERCDAAGRA